MKHTTNHQTIMEYFFLGWGFEGGAGWKTMDKIQRPSLTRITEFYVCKKIMLRQHLWNKNAINEL